LLLVFYADARRCLIDKAFEPLTLLMPSSAIYAMPTLRACFDAAGVATLIFLLPLPYFAILLFHLLMLLL